MLYSLICALVGNSVTDDAAALLIEIVQIAAVAVVFVNGNSFLCPSPEVNRLLIVIILVVTHLALKIQLFTYFPCHENIGITLIILKEVCNFNGKGYAYCTGALSGKMITCPMIPLKKPTSPARWIQILPI
uniref:Uncharacterized protein n=1 Tax=Glossina palpalis gambiensis TaxID=67801 RepID=A0A1B0BIF4_9MUSC